jgi:hypothetical protein
MRTLHAIGFVAAALVAAQLLGCTRESSSGPVKWTASDPASAVGQTEAQSWSRSTSNDQVAPGSDKRRVLNMAPNPFVGPTSVEVPDRPLGVTNAQGGSDGPGGSGARPPTPRWPYDGSTIELGPTP